MADSSSFVANVVTSPIDSIGNTVVSVVQSNVTSSTSATANVVTGAPGVTDHTLLTNIGTNTHAQIDTDLNRLSDTSGTNTGDQNLSTYATTAYVDGVDATKQPLDADLTALAGLTPTNNDALVYTTGAWANRTMAQFKTTASLNNVSNTTDANKPVSTAQAAADALKVAKTGDIMTGDLVLQSLNAANGTTRFYGQTYEETGPNDYTEIIRLDAKTNSAKATLAYRDASSQSKVWLQMHDYLHNYPLATIQPANVNTTSGVVTPDTAILTPTGFQVQFSTTGTLPTGLSASTNYYVRMSAGTFTIYDTSARAVTGGATGQIIPSTQGSGVHTVTPQMTYNNNRHRHFSIEVSDASGTAKQTRLSIPYDYDIAEVGLFSSNFNINDGKLRLVGAQGSYKLLQFGNTMSDNLAPDLTNIRWALQQNITAESGSNVGSDFSVTRYSDTGVALDSPLFIKRSNGFIGIGTQANLNAILNVATNVGVQRASTSAFGSYAFDTAGTTQWNIQQRNDTTQDLHVRDAVNGRSVIRVTQTGQTILGGSFATPIVTKTGAYTATATDHTVLGDATSAGFSITLPTAVNVAGRFYVIKKMDATANIVTIATTSSQTIDGASTKALSAQYAVYHVQSDGANWVII